MQATRWKKALHYKRLGRSTGALAGLASAISVFVGLLAARAAPKGFAKISVALHFAKTPLIVKFAPFFTGVAVAITTAAGLLSFVTWLVEHEEMPPEPGDKIAEKSQEPV
jgi:fumarate reductase subunit C